MAWWQNIAGYIYIYHSHTCSYKSITSAHPYIHRPQGQTWCAGSHFLAAFVRNTTTHTHHTERDETTAVPKLRQFSEHLRLPLGLRAPSSRRSAFFKTILLPLVEQVLRHRRQTQQPPTNHLHAAFRKAQARQALAEDLPKQGLAPSLRCPSSQSLDSRPSVSTENVTVGTALSIRAKDCHTACSSTTTVNQTVLGRQLGSQYQQKISRPVQQEQRSHRQDRVPHILLLHHALFAVVCIGDADTATDHAAPGI